MALQINMRGAGDSPIPLRLQSLGKQGLGLGNRGVGVIRAGGDQHGRPDGANVVDGSLIS